MKITGQAATPFLAPSTGKRAVRLLVAALFAGAISLSGVLVPATAQPARAGDVGGSGWTDLEPVAYGDAQLDLPASWPVLADGTGVCGSWDPGPVKGVVLLGTFGSSN